MNSRDILLGMLSEGITCLFVKLLKHFRIMKNCYNYSLNRYAIYWHTGAQFMEDYNRPELILRTSHFIIQSSHIVFIFSAGLQSSHIENLVKSSVFISPLCQQIASSLSSRLRNHNFQFSQKLGWGPHIRMDLRFIWHPLGTIYTYQKWSVVWVGQRLWVVICANITW